MKKNSKSKKKTKVVVVKEFINSPFKEVGEKKSTQEKHAPKNKSLQVDSLELDMALSPAAPLITPAPGRLSRSPSLESAAQNSNQSNDSQNSKAEEKPSIGPGYVERPADYTSIRVLPENPADLSLRQRTPDSELARERNFVRTRFDEQRVAPPTREIVDTRSISRPAPFTPSDPTPVLPEYVGGNYVPRYVEQSSSADFDDIMKNDFFLKKRRKDL
jgi:hypothetical protein